MNADDKDKLSAFICVLVPILKYPLKSGFLNYELRIAIASGFQGVSLGRRILRAVTAPVVALSLGVHPSFYFATRE